MPSQPLFWRLLRRIGITPKMVYSATGRAKISSEQRDLLNLMRKDNLKAEFPFRATEIWSRINQTFEDLFYTEGIDSVEESSLNSFFAAYPPGHSAYYGYASYMLYQDLIKRDRYGLLNNINASATEGSERAIRFDNNLVSWDFLISLDSLLSIAEADDRILKEPVVVVDLGAGWGRMGYVIKRVNPKVSLVVCDLPETLLVSHSYLPKLLSEDKIYPYIENRNVEFSRKMLLKRHGTTFCGTQDLARFEENSIDYFINIASFQEMTNKQVDGYFKIVDEKVNGLFYILQSYHTGLWGGGGLGTDFKNYPFRENWKQKYIRTVSWFPTFFEAAFKI